MQIPLQLDIWLQSYEEFANAKHNIKQKKFEHCFCLKNYITDIRLIPLIMSQIAIIFKTHCSVLYSSIILLKADCIRETFTLKWKKERESKKNHSNCKWARQFCL